MSRTAILHQLPHRLRAVRNDPEQSHLAVGLRDCNRDRVCMDIKTDKS